MLIMKIIEFVKKDLTGWEKPELLGLLLVFSVIIINAITVKDSLISVISAICGITYTFMAGKGRVSCYLFGLTGSGFYCWLAFINALWGNLLLYACYYIPMQILGFWRWSKHVNSKTNEIVKIKLTKQENSVLCITTILITAITIIILRLMNSSNPFIDGITTVFSVAGMYLTVRRAIEQWVVWMIVNFLSALMWINIILQGEKAYATVIMWITYFVFAIYFYMRWKKEIFT